jgi:hypothetical protein
MREQTDRQFLTEKVFEDFYYVLTLFCIIRYHIHIPYHFCLLNSCFGTYKSVLVAALKKILAAETNSRSGPRIKKVSEHSKNLQKLQKLSLSKIGGLSVHTCASVVSVKQQFLAA